MKIINELSYSQIKNNKKDTLATKLSIFLAVVLLGTVIFIIGSIKTEEYRSFSPAFIHLHIQFSFQTSYTIARLDEDELVDVDLSWLVLDEAQFIKNQILT